MELWMIALVIWGVGVAAMCVAAGYVHEDVIASDLFFWSWAWPGWIIPVILVRLGAWLRVRRAK